MKIKELEKYRPFFNAMIRHSIVPQSEFGKHADDGQLVVTVHSIDESTITVNVNRTLQTPVTLHSTDKSREITVKANRAFLMVLQYEGNGYGVRLGDKLVINTRTGTLTPIGMN